MDELTPRPKEELPYSGRPPKIDDDRINMVVTAMKNLATQKMAAQKAGLSEKTFYNYMNRGEEILRLREENPDSYITRYDDLYVKFYLAVREAEDAVKQRHLENIEDHSDKKWQASAWILERRWPDEFALRSTVRHEGADGGPIEFTLKLGDPPSDEYEEIEEADYELLEEKQ